MKIQIEKPIRQNDTTTQGNDVLTVKTALNGLGYYKTPDYGLTEYPDHSMFNSIRSFQRDNDLQVDGIINPNGETIREINSQIKTSARTPTIWCPQCGAPHGGSKGDLCPDCDSKQG